MIWGPFLLALALGLVVSAGLYFAYLWPQVEPDDEAIDAAASVAGATVAPAAAGAADAKPAAATAAADAKPADTTAAAEAEADGETAAEAPSSESSPA